MTKSQSQRLDQLREEVRKAEAAISRKRQQLRDAAAQCNHRYGNGHDAWKSKSTHDMDSCGGYHECAVCAGEQPETFVNVCQICKKVGEPFITQVPFGKALRT